MGENAQIPLDDTKVGFDLESFESTHDVYYSAKDVTQGLKYNWESSYTVNYKNALCALGIITLSISIYNIRVK